MTTTAPVRVRGATGPPVVTAPVPRRMWESMFRSDPDAVVSQSPAWRDAVFSGGRYQDASLLYEFRSGGRVLVPMARPRWRPPRAVRAASWPGGWGVGGPLSLGGRITPGEARAVLHDIARRWPLGAEMHLRHEAGAAWLSEAGAARFRAEPHGCHVLDLDGGFSRVWEHRFRGTARTAVRKAERSVLEVEVDRSGRLLPVFYDLYEKSIQRWASAQREPLWLSRWRTNQATPRSMFTSVAKHFGTNCGIWVASAGGVPVAAIVVLQSGGYAKYWRGAMDKELAAGLRANDLLHRLAIEDACRGGYRWYDMGYSRPASPLAAFKEKLGAHPHRSYTLRAERLPVHAAGHISRNAVKRVIRFQDM